MLRLKNVYCCVFDLEKEREAPVILLLAISVSWAVLVGYSQRKNIGRREEQKK